MHLQGEYLILDQSDHEKVEVIDLSIEYEDSPQLFEVEPGAFEHTAEDTRDNRQALLAAAALLEAGVAGADIRQIDIGEIRAIPLRDRLHDYTNRLKSMNLYHDKEGHYSEFNRAYMVPSSGELDPVVAIRPDELEEVKKALEKSDERFVPEARPTRFTELLGEINALQAEVVPVE